MTDQDAHSLFKRLDALGVAHHTTWHPPIFTVEEGRDLKAQIPGGHSKNLFLKTKKGAYWLICALADTRIDLNATAKALGAGRFSFGSEDALWRMLRVRPGAVTAFGLMHAAPGSITPVLDAALLAHDPVCFHPLTNAATTAVSPDGLASFLADCGHDPWVVAFDEAGAPREIASRPD